MPEPITTIGIGAIAAYLGKDGLAKLLGPTAEYLGDELQEFTKKRIENVGRIFQNAENKLGDKIETTGSVPPKVLKTIINEGSYSEDEIAVEYFGGVLASARSSLIRDDRGARVAKTLDNMSSYQLRCHYLIYSTISNLFSGEKFSLNTWDNRSKLEIYLPWEEFVDAMDLTQEEWENPQILTHTFHGLMTDSLIEKNWAYGSKENLLTMSNGILIDGPGIVCTPTANGAELFLWGFGAGNKELDYIFSKKFSSLIEGMTSCIKNSKGTKTYTKQGV